MITKSGLESDIRDFQVREGQKRLRARYPDAPHVFAHGAAEVLVKLATDLNRMASDLT